jgi:hypothetical protein
MMLTHQRNEGWPRGRPFFLVAALAIAGCASGGTPKMQSRPDPADCAPVTPEASRRFVAEAYASGLPERGQWRDRFDLADFNADGVPDLLHGPARKGDGLPKIFLGARAGTFALWPNLRFPKLPFDYGAIKAGDVNGDGVPDLALASHLRGFVALIHEGRGQFASWGEGLTLHAPTERVAEPGFSSRTLQLHDWNGDGKLDLLAVNEGPTVFAPPSADTASLALWINRGGFWESVRASRPAKGFGDDLAIADVDGDGRADALIGSQVMDGRHLLHLARERSYSVREVVSLPKDATVPAVALIKDAGDRRARLLMASLTPVASGFCSGLQRIDWREAEEHASMLWRTAGTDAIRVLRSADIDGDSVLDLVAVRESGATMLFAGQGRGVYSADAVIPAPPAYAGCKAYDAYVHDFDGDGRLELIVSFAGEGGAFNFNDCPTGGGFATWHLGKR